MIPVKSTTVAYIQNTADLPPEAEVKNLGNYHYHPCPTPVANPCLSIPYLHSLLSPGKHQHRFWTHRTPKKLKEMLRYQNDLVDVIGWGVHIIEGPNYLAIALLVAISLLLSITLALAYSLTTHDVSGGFTIASFFLAAEGLVVTLGTTILITALSHPS